MSIRSSRLLAKLYLSYFAVALLGEIIILPLWSVVSPLDKPLAWLSILGTAVVSAAVLALVAVLSPRRHVLKPIRTLTDQARAIAAG
ncbi:MAG: hypothetical protein ACM3VX_00315, partial [Bacteroidota bacterium]